MAEKKVKQKLMNTSEAENAYTVEPCPECNGTNLLHDEISGELVCRDCGLVVLETAEFTPPTDRIPKHIPSNPLAYTSASVGREVDSYQRLEIKAAFDIERVVQLLKYPKTAELLAINYVCRLRRAMRQQTNPKIRFTCTELTAIAIWTALKQLKYPLNCNEFTQQIKPILGNVNIMKTEKRALPFINNTPRIPDITLVTAHINKIINMLESNFIIDNYYANILSKYAIQMVHAKQNLVKGRKSDLIAASAVFAADCLIAEHFTLRVFAEFTNVGAGNLSTFAETFKRSAPPVPKESAAIHFTGNLFRRIF